MRIHQMSYVADNNKPILTMFGSLHDFQFQRQQCIVVLCQYCMFKLYTYMLFSYTTTKLEINYY